MWIDRNEVFVEFAALELDLVKGDDGKYVVKSAYGHQNYET